MLSHSRCGRGSLRHLIDTIYLNALGALEISYVIFNKKQSIILVSL